MIGMLQIQHSHYFLLSRELNLEDLAGGVDSKGLKRYRSTYRPEPSRMNFVNGFSPDSKWDVGGTNKSLYKIYRVDVL